MLISARVFGELMKRWGQAPVIGELLAGVVLRPSLLGFAAPSVDHWIFVDGPLQGEIIDALSWVGSDSKQISISCAVLDAPSF